MTTITEELREFIVDNFLFNDASARLSEETSFLDSGIIDSTGVLELISFLQRRYSIWVNDEEIVPENLDSLKRLTAYVERKLADTSSEVMECR